MLFHDFLPGTYIHMHIYFYEYVYLTISTKCQFNSNYYKTHWSGLASIKHIRNCKNKNFTHVELLFIIMQRGSATPTPKARRSMGAVKKQKAPCQFLQIKMKYNC